MKPTRLLIALLAAIAVVAVVAVASAPSFAQIESVGDEPETSLTEKEKPDDPAEPSLDEIESVIEEAGGDANFAKWLEEKCAYRRIVTLVPVPQIERGEVVAIGGLSPRRLAEYGQLGSGVVVRSAAGERLEVFADEAADVCAVKLPEELRKRSHVQLVVYYGDSAANGATKSLGRALSDAELKAYTCFLGTEESKSAEASRALVERSIKRYGQLVVAEPSAKAKSQSVAGAHLGTVAAFDENGDQVWFEHLPAESAGGKVRLRFHAPVRVAAKIELDYTCGEASRGTIPLEVAGQGFFWVDTTLGVRKGCLMRVRAPNVKGLALDCAAISSEADWKPDYASISGPMWVRFRFPKGGENVESLELSASHITYSEDGVKSVPDGSFAANAWFQTPGMRKLFPARRLKPRFESGKWTPWGRLKERGSYTWFETLTVKGSGQLPSSIEMQFAFEPYEGAVFRQNVAEVEGGVVVRFRMPMTPDDFHDAMNFARTFEDGIDVRAAWVKELGLTGEDRPRKLAFSVFHDAELTDRMHAKTLEMMRLVGFNGVDQLNPKYADDYAKAGFDSHHEHAWIDSLDADWDNLPGATYGEKLDSYRKHILATVPNWRPSLDLGRFNVLGDEIGPAVDEGAMHENPALHRLFVLYCKEKRATPEMFGVKEFDEIKWPVPVLGKRARKAERQKEFDRIAAEAVSDTPLGEEGGDELVLEEADEDAAKARAAARAKQQIEELADERIDKRRSEGVVVVPDPNSPAGKRLRWYVRLFQTDFTVRTYHAHAEAIHNRSKVKTVSGPNFQAEPVHSGRMWDGGLDVMTYGRMGGPYAMVQIEDWVGNEAFANCAYAGALIRAACRTSGAAPAALVTGGQSRPKIIAWLSQGVRKFDSYTYGPIHRIGPVWADDRASYANIGETLAAIGRVEEDVLACSPRNDVALLVANTSEITKKTGGMNRIAMFAELTYAGHQPDVVSEDDVLLDGILKKYRALVVVDEAVRSETQDAIAKWASDGGAVYVVPGAAAFDQFEQPTQTLGKLRRPAAEGAKLRQQLRDFAARAGVKPKASTDAEGVWVSTAEGDGRQVIFIIRGGEGGGTTRITVPRASKPRDVVSGFRGPIKEFTFADGAVALEVALPAVLDGDILVIK